MRYGALALCRALFRAEGCSVDQRLDSSSLPHLLAPAQPSDILLGQCLHSLSLGLRILPQSGGGQGPVLQSPWAPWAPGLIPAHRPHLSPPDPSCPRLRPVHVSDRVLLLAGSALHHACSPGHLEPLHGTPGECLPGQVSRAGEGGTGAVSSSHGVAMADPWGAIQHTILSPKSLVIHY